VLARVLDIYGGSVGASPSVDGALRLIRERVAAELRQGLTLVHFSAQLEPCVAHKTTLHTLNTP